MTLIPASSPTRANKREECIQLAGRSFGRWWSPNASQPIRMEQSTRIELGLLYVNYQRQSIHLRSAKQQQIDGDAQFCFFQLAISLATCSLPVSSSLLVCQRTSRRAGRLRSSDVRPDAAQWPTIIHRRLYNRLHWRHRV